MPSSSRGGPGSPSLAWLARGPGLGRAPRCALERLPDEALAHVLDELSWRDVAAFESASPELRRVVHARDAWAALAGKSAALASEALEGGIVGRDGDHASGKGFRGRRDDDAVDAVDADTPRPSPHLLLKRLASRLARAAEPLDPSDPSHRGVARANAAASARSSSSARPRPGPAPPPPPPVPAPNLAREAMAASSTDRPEAENVANVLARRVRPLYDSRAFRIRPSSYWSSAGSVASDAVDRVVLRLVTPVAIVRAVRVAAFRAPVGLFTTSGVYAPVKIRFHVGLATRKRDEIGSGSGSGTFDVTPRGFSACPRASGRWDVGEGAHASGEDGGGDDLGEYLWSSETYDFDAGRRRGEPGAEALDLDPGVARFEFPEPVLCVGGMLQIELIGRRTRQRVDERWYVALGHVAVEGAPVEGYAPAVAANGKNDSRRVPRLRALDELMDGYDAWPLADDRSPGALDTRRADRETRAAFAALARRYPYPRELGAAGAPRDDEEDEQEEEEEEEEEGVKGEENFSAGGVNDVTPARTVGWIFVDSDEEDE